MVKTDMKKIQPEPSEQMKSSTSSSSLNNKYKGVRMRSWGSWVSEIRVPNQKTRIWLGSYSTAEAAARAYDAALLCLKGSSGNLNFPITSYHYIPDSVLSPKSIQRVAAAAANSFVDSAAAAPPISSSPSSACSSSPSDQAVDEDDDYMSLIQSLVANDEPVSLMEQWYPSLDQMLNVSSFHAPSTINDFYEEGDDDIRLWSFC
ncbi:ethylene-responsive transcription factor ERF014-like isoform X2 [Hibiscus syriacus]|uniref:ethylene-responsive transcription factor ERF014-like isoform X2 n=1 Tax=Hibiscus syriacus TaxID=106335 RepID=UPI00192111B5|nr:ethylene-responsive transcription factor ERF014-like isoform X2 [Hibiscus syriacus]